MRNKDRILNTVWILCVCGGIAGCDKDVPATGDTPSYVIDTSAPFVFTAHGTRGSLPLDMGNLIDKHFSVSGFLTGETSFAAADATRQEYFSNIEFLKEGDFWRGADPVYWLLDAEMKFSFFAYAPYDRDGSQIVWNSLSDSGWPSLTVTPSAGVTNQYDFCVASPLIDKTRNDKLPVVFNHMLTNIELCAAYSGELPGSNYKVQVDEITISNVVGSNLFSFSMPGDGSPGYQWSDNASAERDASYTLTTSGAHLRNTLTAGEEIPKVSDGVVFKHLQLVNGYLYLVPQSLGENAELKIAYSLYETDANNQNFLKSSFTGSKKLTGEWKPGCKVTYNITIFVGASNKIEIGTPVIEEWKVETETEGGTL